MHTKYCDDNYYHVYNRGAHKSVIFFSEENYRYCVTLLRKYSSRYHVSLIAFCLMPNHYHLILKQQTGGSIARFLQTTFNAYTQAVNKQQSMSGTLFEGRAKSLCVSTDKYLSRLVCYIHCNPVTAMLVHTAEKWEFSDCQEWIGIGAFQGFEVRDMFFADGREYKAALEQYTADRARLEIEKYLFN